MPNNHDEDLSESEKQVRRIHRLAERLPWISVILMVIITTLLILQAALFRH